MFTLCFYVYIKKILSYYKYIYIFCLFECVESSLSWGTDWPLTFYESVYLFLCNPVFLYTPKPKEVESANTASIWCNTWMWKTHVTEPPLSWPFAKPRLETFQTNPSLTNAVWQTLDLVKCVCIYLFIVHTMKVCLVQRCLDSSILKTYLL